MFLRMRICAQQYTSRPQETIGTTQLQVVMSAVSMVEADTEYDRIYLDFALAYNYKGLLLRTYDGNDIKIGVKIYAVKDGAAKVLKDAQFKLTDLDNKNRLEYYYGIDNTRPNFQNYTYYAVPYLTVNDAPVATMKITNSGVVAIKDIATKPLSGDNKHAYPTIENVVYD